MNKRELIAILVGIVLVTAIELPLFWPRPSDKSTVHAGFQAEHPTHNTQISIEYAGGAKWKVTFNPPYGDPAEVYFDENSGAVYSE